MVTWLAVAGHGVVLFAEDDRTVRPDMAILLISGHPERAGVGLDLASAHAGSLLLKPFTPDVLAARINDALEKRRSQPRT